jgi:hypothetical protein
MEKFPKDLLFQTEVAYRMLLLTLVPENFLTLRDGGQ